MACTYTSNHKCMCLRINGKGSILKYKYMKGTGNGISLSKDYSIKCPVNLRLPSHPCDLEPQKYANDIRANRIKWDWYLSSLLQV